MSKSVKDLAQQYADLTALADKLQNRDQLSPAAMQTLAGILARISMLELQLYGEADIYCRTKRNENAEAPF